MFTRAWLVATLEQLAIVAAIAFVAALVAGGTAFNVSTLHAAVLAAYGAVITFLQSTLAQLVKPKQAPVQPSVVHAVAARLAA